MYQSGMEIIENYLLMRTILIRKVSKCALFISREILFMHYCIESWMLQGVWMMKNVVQVTLIGRRMPTWINFVMQSLK